MKIDEICFVTQQKNSTKYNKSKCPIVEGLLSPRSSIDPKMILRMYECHWYHRTLSKNSLPMKETSSSDPGIAKRQVKRIRSSFWTELAEAVSRLCKSGHPYQYSRILLRFPHQLECFNDGRRTCSLDDDRHRVQVSPRTSLRRTKALRF